MFSTGIYSQPRVDIVIDSAERAQQAGVVALLSVTQRGRLPVKLQTRILHDLKGEHAARASR
jgi:hypothetical protein